MRTMTDAPSGLLHTIWDRMKALRRNLEGRIALMLTVAAILSGSVTYGVLTASAFDTDPKTVFWLLNLNLVLLLLLGMIIVRRVVTLWLGSQKHIAGARLQRQFVMVFSFLAITPAILMTIFSTLFFSAGIQAWFSDTVSTAVNESLTVAEAYLHEHQNTIRADALAMANDLNRIAPRLLGNSNALMNVVRSQALLRNITEAIVFDGSGEVRARSGLAFALELEPVEDILVDKAREGEVVLITSDEDNRVRALVQLDRFVDTFLYVGRLIDPAVLHHTRITGDAVKQYTALQGRLSDLQITVTMIFVVVALLLLMAAAWTGLVFAQKLAAPISHLIGAAEKIRGGNLSARVPESPRHDEMSDLLASFNRMTEQLDTQRQELVAVNDQLDTRRRFTETVLAGVTGGICGLDADGRITLMNPAAADLFGGDSETLVGTRMVTLLPESMALFDRLKQSDIRMVEDHLSVRRTGEPDRTLLVRLVADRFGTHINGYVLTLEDITDLLSAQRKAAWADVARRVAHEIKNPLTPIQLSAERLRRKYEKEIQTEPEVFARCTDTIIRQVGEIGRMVSEFSRYARMPEARLEETDIIELCRRALFLTREAFPQLDIVFTPPEPPITLDCDEQLVSQALTNILKNAAESVDTRMQGDPDFDHGQIVLDLLKYRDTLELRVTDNGQGLPDTDRSTLTDPYVTTRARGSGLGLAIVKKIMEDHNGRITLRDHPDNTRGAVVALEFPLQV